MKYIVALGLFSGLAAAQSATTTAASSSSTSVSDLVSQLPTCAVSCLSSAASQIGCAATDFTCLCKSQDKLVSTLAPCVVLSGCSSDEITAAADVAPKICSAVQNNPNASDVASASNIVTGALGTATGGTAATATASTSALPTANAASRERSIGMFSIVALVAAVLR